MEDREPIRQDERLNCGSKFADTTYRGWIRLTTFINIYSLADISRICCKNFLNLTVKFPSTTIHEDKRDTYLRTDWIERVVRVVRCRWLSLLRLRKEIA